MTATWSFVPQAVLEERLETAVTIVPVTPLVDVVGRSSDTILRGFQLQYATVTSATAQAMAAFFTTQAGGFIPFTFRNPNDQQDYTVRFDTDLRIEHFRPAFFRTNPLAFLTVPTTLPPTVASLFIIDGQLRTTYATFGQSVAAGSAVTVTFTSPLTGHAWVRVLAATSGPATTPYSFAVQYAEGTSLTNAFAMRQPFRVSTSALLEYEVVGAYGRVTLTLASSAAWCEGAVYLIPVR